MARSNIRPTPKASCKIAALSLCVAIANLCDLWVKLVPTVEIISPEVCRPHTSLSPWYALTVHQKQTCSNFSYRRWADLNLESRKLGRHASWFLKHLPSLPGLSSLSALRKRSVRLLICLSDYFSNILK